MILRKMIVTFMEQAYVNLLINNLLMSLSSLAIAKSLSKMMRAWSLYKKTN